MKTPLILITYGLSQKLCTWEENNIIKLPIFSEPVLAAEFVKSFRAHFKNLLEDKEDLQIQICNNPKHALDMIKMIGIIQPLVNIIYNPSPMGQEPEEAVAKLANQFTDMATVVNRHYNIEQAVEALESFAAEHS